ncbi:helix-turn-helix domain-containing protein [Nocardia suismassiliense]|uniref:Helix-turn-helix domain-containing protein n=1 Tax=Nocardia suismassiliense TaxID=2077092 RepID=A0ABW6R127_9NOCA
MTVIQGSSILDLLLEDADISAYDAALERARQAGAPVERMIELEHERTVAMRLREKLLNHRRNEAELQLLNDTANDLAAMRDPDSILQAIADRARRLLGCDLAYISLSDRTRGDCFIKAASGNISGLMNELRLPRGAGVGGKVARTGEPYSVSSYFDDDTLERTPEIDATVEAERIESLLGVPVKLKQDIIGVLLAAHRSQRPFSSRDIGALVMLAAHAAVAIENSRLLTATQAAVADLRVANATIQTHLAELERTAEVHERLTKLVIEGVDVAAVIEATAAAVTGEVVLLSPDTDPPTSTEQVEALARRAHAKGHSVVEDRLCAVPLITESESLGTLVLLGSAAVDDTDRRILERAALVAALVLVTRRRMAEAEARVRGELLADLLAAQTHDHDLLRRRAALLEVDLDSCHVVVVAELETEPREPVFAAIAALARRLRCLATVRHRSVILLLPGTDARTIARDAARELTRITRAPVTAGAATADGPTTIAASYEEAARCTRALIALDRLGSVGVAADLGFVGTLFSGEPNISGYVRSVLGPVLDYDQERGAELLQTLDVFCATGQNSTKAAQLLHLHVNTVTQRLTRLAQLLGDDWREPEQLLEIQVALRLLKAQGA